ncbi:NAD(P)-binding domain-containing protein [Actinophytocola oryzae]|uniref:Pyrroline-5-carboxylate reductase n=1 Tax=Actinophytocola oryzae TaxID=502181 RepID=A0A4R7UY17_9PSEU|nr:NAD(P)-binding domain-containing protein [Actinophytocola oryzae]TDV40962.1 pyrroline-5-carboxylate reductase [Actinophytocola oryzae]
MRQSYGFVGAGELTAAVVTGLNADAAAPPEVFLSPRGRAVGRELADRFPNVRVRGSNQEVLDATTTVVLAVRPPVAAEVLAELTFRPEHVVVSALAGVHLARLREWTAPAGHVVRSIPLPQAVRRQSLTALYPDHAVARELFERVGGVVVPAEEAALDSFSAATATFAAHLDYLTTIAGWLADHGVDRDTASAYTAHIFGQLGESLLTHTGDLAELTGRYMTPGGINEQLLGDLRGAGVPDTVRGALDRVLARLRG